MERFWRNVKIGAPNECWEWTATLDGGGYGVFHANKKMIRAHAFSFISARGGVPQGLVLDHLCGNRKCVNPAHLEAVTQRINAIRAKGRIKSCTHRTKRDTPCEQCIARHLAIDPGECRSHAYRSTKAWRIANVRARHEQTARYHKKFGPSSRLPWTDEENRQVLARDVTDPVLAARINRSVKAIQVRRVVLRKTLKEARP